MKPFFESLKLFYLGKETNKEQTPILYKNKDLTTHAIVIGMTGSGKTGLGIDIIEEAAIDNIPSIIIDPKGDMGNLLLAFPNMQANDFLPWTQKSLQNEDIDINDLAKQTAYSWENGLSSWDIPKSRIQTLKENADFTIYTPGSNVGVSISMLNSFDYPSDEILNDNENLNFHISSIVTSLLGLVNIQSNAFSGKEHILLSSILNHEFINKKNVSIENLISYIINPPIEKIGVFSIENFYNKEKRTELAMKINSLVASPAFDTWKQGEPLDVEKLLFTKNGKARVSIFTISHLSDTQRMFFVSILLNNFISWLRKQEGSESLRAIIYMDEIFGYFPPLGNPPTKLPMLTLLKQARAYGVGIILSTQNPVDIDYKGLSNIGTWFIGKLQTSQDKQKVIDGLKGIQGSQINDKDLLTTISSLPKRTFLLKNIHQEGLKVFQTRWTMSYLKGPLSKEQISTLMKTKKMDFQEKKIKKTNEFDSTIPIINNKILQIFSYRTDNNPWDLIPFLVLNAKVKFYDAKREIDKIKTFSYKYYLDSSLNQIDWQMYEIFDEIISPMRNNNLFSALPFFILKSNSFLSFEKEFADYLYRNEKLELFKANILNIESNPNESLESFRLRLQDFANKKIDEEIEKIMTEFGKIKNRLEANLQRAGLKLEKEKSDVKSKTVDTIISIGTSIASAIFGKNILSQTSISKTSSSAKSVSKVLKEKKDVQLAQSQIDSINEEIYNLSEKLKIKIEETRKKFDSKNIEIQTITITPRRTDIFDVKSCLLWKEI